MRDGEVQPKIRIFVWNVTWIAWDEIKLINSLKYTLKGTLITRIWKKLSFYEYAGNNYRQFI